MKPQYYVDLVLARQQEFTSAAAGNMAALWLLGQNPASAVSRDFWLGVIIGILSTVEGLHDDTTEFDLGQILILLDKHFTEWSNLATLKFLTLAAEIVANRHSNN